MAPAVSEVAAEDAGRDGRDAEAGEDERGLAGACTELTNEQHAEEGHREAAEPVDAPGDDEDSQLPWQRDHRRASVAIAILLTVELDFGSHEPTNRQE